MKRRDLLKSIGFGIGVVSVGNTKIATADPIGTNNSDFNCTQCGWCCKQSRRKDLWKEPLTLDQQVQVQVAKTDYEDHGGCPALGFKDGLYWCITHVLFGETAKPKDCQDYPYDNPEKLCYPYFKDEINWKKTKMTPDHLHLIVTSKSGDVKEVKFI